MGWQVFFSFPRPVWQLVPKQAPLFKFNKEFLNNAKTTLSVSCCLCNNYIKCIFSYYFQYSIYITTNKVTTGSLNVTIY